MPLVSIEFLYACKSMKFRANGLICKILCFGDTLGIETCQYHELVSLILCLLHEFSCLVSHCIRKWKELLFICIKTLKNNLAISRERVK